MKKNPIILAMVLLLGLAACASSYPALTSATSNSAAALAAYCEGIGLKSTWTESGRQLYLEGEKLAADDQEKEAYAKFDLAVLHYRLAIANHEYTLSQRKLEQALTRLADADKKINYYNNLLKKLKLPIEETNL